MRILLEFLPEKPENRSSSTANLPDRLIYLLHVDEGKCCLEEGEDIVLFILSQLLRRLDTLPNMIGKLQHGLQTPVGVIFEGAIQVVTTYRTDLPVTHRVVIEKEKGEIHVDGTCILQDQFPPDCPARNTIDTSLKREIHGDLWPIGWVQGSYYNKTPENDERALNGGSVALGFFLSLIEMETPPIGELSYDRTLAHLGKLVGYAVGASGRAFAEAEPAHRRGVANAASNGGCAVDTAVGYLHHKGVLRFDRPIAPRRYVAGYFFDTLRNAGDASLFDAGLRVGRVVRDLNKMTAHHVGHAYGERLGEMRTSSDWDAPWEPSAHRQLEIEGLVERIIAAASG